MPWLIVSIVGLVACLVVLLVIGWRSGLTKPEDERAPVKWVPKMTSIAGNHTQVAGVLAGLAFTVVVLVAASLMQNERSGTERILDQAVIGLFLIASFGYVGTGVLYSVVEEGEESKLEEDRSKDYHKFYLFAAASVLYLLSVVLTFSAMRPLLALLEAELLATFLSVMVAGVSVGGFMAVCIPLVGLFGWRRRTCLVVFLAAVFAVGICNTLGTVISEVAGSERFLSLGLPVSGLLVGVIFSWSMLTLYSKRLRRKRVLEVSVFGVTVIGLVASLYPAVAALTFLGA